MTRHVALVLLGMAVALWVGAYVYYRPAGVSVIGWLEPRTAWDGCMVGGAFYGGYEEPDALRDLARAAGYYLFLPLNLLDRRVLGNHYLLTYPFYW